MVDPCTRMPCDCSSLASACVSAPLSFWYWLPVDSSPSQIHSTPSCTSSRGSYFLMALADENT